MATFNSNLNNVSSTYSLKALKKRITTCFHHWRRKAFELKKQQPEEYHQNSYKEYSILNRNFNWKHTKIFPPSKAFGRHCKGSRSRLSGGQVDIVTNFMSSTLIATTKITAATAVHSMTEIENKMNFSDGDSYEDLRDEFPDIDAEVRSILISRSQDGSTIAEIKEDYRKNTGTHFPVSINVTEFLLSIPSVTCYCSEQGTRIFNVIPSNRNKHIFNMVQQQKSITITSARPPLGSYGRQQYGTNADNHNVHYPYSNYKNNNNNLNANYYNQNNNQTLYAYAQQKQYPPHPLPITVELPPPTQAYLPLVAQESVTQQQPQHEQVEVADQNILNGNSNGYVESNYYQDNWNYLNNRFYNQPNASSLTTIHNLNTKQNSSNNTFSANNNINSNSNTIHTTKNSNNIQKPNELNYNNWNKNNLYPYGKTHVAKRPTTTNGPLQLPPPSKKNSITSSSPTGTRSSQTTDSIYTVNSDYEAHLLDFPLLGDDFLLYLARMELKCKFKKYERVLQSGLCVSGQSITAAISRVKKMGDCDKKMIINIGSVDIMQGKQLVQIEHDFRQLVNLLRKKGITPILTTLAPLANYSHVPQIKEKLERFNKFIKKEGQFLLVIDIYSVLVNDRKQTLFDCYQSEPRTVTGAIEPYVFWNKIGRQRVLQLIESKLEY